MAYKQQKDKDHSTHRQYITGGGGGSATQMTCSLSVSPSRWSNAQSSTPRAWTEASMATST